VLEVLRACAPFPRQHVIAQKLVKFLTDSRSGDDHWLDKWHVSPYYATAHALFALLEAAPDVCLKAFTFLKNSQREDGSWGWFDQGTPEETAYAVQALMAAPAAERAGFETNLVRAEQYLNETDGEPVIPMWVGKTLYAPEAVIDSAVLSARILLARRAAC
jgi:hypothetical protein